MTPFLLGSFSNFKLLKRSFLIETRLFITKITFLLQNKGESDLLVFIDVELGQLVPRFLVAHEPGRTQ